MILYQSLRLKSEPPVAERPSSRNLQLTGDRIGLINSTLNASGLIYNAPENGYWEYNVGIGNIFKVFKIAIFIDY